MSELRVLDLFSGIGGFSLGLKRAGGFRTVAYCEIEPYCQEVLRARMRDGSLDTAPICTDIRKLDGKPWAGRVDLICGGFPCQDISTAGHGEGISGEKSGLWTEYARLLREVRPRFALIENSPELANRGLDQVLSDLAEMGMDAVVGCIRASSLGAKHRRERMYVVAYANGDGLQGGDHNRSAARLTAPSLDQLADWPPVSEPFGIRNGDGVSSRVDRTHAIGNAVVPQVIEWIGRRILEIA